MAAGEPRLYGACNFEIGGKPSVTEPRDDVRGDAAEDRLRIDALERSDKRIREEISDEIVTPVSGEGELERAKAILARKYREPATTAKERARRARFLQSRGFPMEVIARLLRGSEELA